MTNTSSDVVPQAGNSLDREPNVPGSGRIRVRTMTAAGKAVVQAALVFPKDDHPPKDGDAS